MNSTEFMEAQLAAMPEGLSFLDAGAYIARVAREMHAYPRPPAAPRMWRRNPDGERACASCSGFGAVDYDAGFTGGMASMECPACNGTGSPHIATLRI